MAVDYNVVILGGSLTARYAADVAARFQARVALVEPPQSADILAGAAFDHIIIKALQAAARQQIQQHAFQQQRTQQRTSSLSPASASDPTALVVDWHTVRDWVKYRVAQEVQGRSLAALASGGVDVVKAAGEFCRRPKVGVVADSRLLRAHAYLIAPSTHPIMPRIEGLATVPYLTPDRLLTRQESLKGHGIILGDNPTLALPLAQSLAGLGLAITLVFPQSSFLPDEDDDTARLVLAMLEATGVEVLIGTTITQAHLLDGQQWVQVGDRAIATDHLILVPRHRPQLEPLNLGAVSIQADLDQLSVDAKLRTTNRRIYACGEAIAPHFPPFLMHHQADIAVKNALFLATRRYHHQLTPFIIPTDPPLARVGLTEQQARHRVGNNFIILSPHALALVSGTLEQSTEFCKVIVHRSGKILGAHSIGTTSRELVQAIALMMHTKQPIQSITAQPFTSGACAKLMAALLLDWQTQSLKHNHLRFNLLELAMNWRRDWSRG